MNSASKESIANGGTSFFWDANELSRLANPDEVFSLREFFLVKNWEEFGDLPSCDSRLLVVGGLDAALKCMKHDEALDWLQKELRPKVQEFHRQFQLQAGLCFFLAINSNEISYNAGNQDYFVKVRESEQPLPLLTPVFGGYKDGAIQIVKRAENAKANKLKETEQIGVLVKR